LVHGFFTSKCRRNAGSDLPYRDVHTARRFGGETLAYFRGSSLVSARDPSLPRVARLDHQATGLVIVFLGLIALL
jgi:hypothetical protein